QPFYLTNQAKLKGEYLTKIGFKVNALPSTMSIVFKNVNDYTGVTDQTIDGVYCTITSTSLDWTEYDLSDLSDPRIQFNPEYLVDDKIIIPESGRIIGFGKKDELCRTAFANDLPSTSYPDMRFYISANKTVAGSALAFDIFKTEY